MTIKSRLSATLRSPKLFRLGLRLALGLGNRPESQRTAGHILICPPGAGNLGDQALVEAFLENTTGHVTLIARSTTDFEIPAAHQERAAVTALPNLLYGYVPRNLGDIRRLGRLIRSSQSVSICGADIMDGAYNYRASCNRSAIAELAAKRQIDARVLGFSWNGSPDRRALDALRRAADRGAKLFVRDPLSTQRLSLQGIKALTQVADMVFSATSVETSAAARIMGQFSDPDRPVAIVNASGLIRGAVDSTEAYADVVRSLLETHSVLLLPHVQKANSDDLKACSDVLAAVNYPPDAILVTEPMSPSKVRGLCRKADLIITGRMHLAVNALHQLRAPVTLATQGKVEGLMQFFDAPKLCVSPSPGMAGPILEAIKVSSAIGEDEIAQHLRSVQTLSAKNFVGLNT